jgi:hypothetical protein
VRAYPNCAGRVVNDADEGKISKQHKQAVRLAIAIFIMKKRAIRAIRRNIQGHGHHIYDVRGGPLPPWSYSIGLSEQIGFEVIFAGGLYFDEPERPAILDGCIERMTKQASSEYESSLGQFHLHLASESWPDELFLGAIDHYGHRPKFMQIYPGEDSLTMDVPRLFESWSAKDFPVWKWLEEDWNYSIPPGSVALTDTDILGGHAKAEVACRFGKDYWKIYSRQPEEIEDRYKRFSPLGAVLALHPDVEAIAHLRTRHAIERLKNQSNWHPWSGRVARK